MSRAARMTLAYETDLKVSDVEKLATSFIPLTISARPAPADHTGPWAW